MYSKDVMVQNQVGLHARPATFFIQKANEFRSSIWIEKEERRVNAKSLLGILSLGIIGGTQIKIIADGADEQAAVNALVELVESGFSEEIPYPLVGSSTNTCVTAPTSFPFCRIGLPLIPCTIPPVSCNRVGSVTESTMFCVLSLPL